MAKLILALFVGVISCIWSSTDAQRVQSNVTSNTLGRVVGGRVADPHQYPFQVAIFYRNVGLICGGSLYNKDTVISAAHCFGPSVPTANYIVALGKHDLSKREGSEILTTVKSITNHPEYTDKKKLNDISILKLSTKVCLGEHINTIPITKPGSKLPKQGFVSGWGYTAARQANTPLQEEHFLPVLKSAVAEVLEENLCKQRFGEMKVQQAVEIASSDTTFCAWHEEGHDSCQGDSGGPMFCIPAESETQRFELCGIVSTGIGCGLEKTPALYTDVSKFHNWIVENAGKSDSCEP